MMSLKHIQTRWLSSDMKNIVKELSSFSRLRTRYDEWHEWRRVSQRCAKKDQSSESRGIASFAQLCSQVELVRRDQKHFSHCLIFDNSEWYRQRYQFFLFKGFLFLLVMHTREAASIGLRNDKNVTFSEKKRMKQRRSDRNGSKCVKDIFSLVVPQWRLECRVKFYRVNWKKNSRKRTEKNRFHRVKLFAYANNLTPSINFMCIHFKWDDVTEEEKISCKEIKLRWDWRRRISRRRMRKAEKDEKNIESTKERSKLSSRIYLIESHISKPQKKKVSRKSIKLFVCE